MSRIGKRPVPLPAGVSAAVEGSRITIKGPKGELSRLVHAEMRVQVSGGAVSVARPSDEARHKALHGLTRTLIRNMVDGVTKGYSKQLEIHGVGYKAEAATGGVTLSLGFSHPVKFKAPKGIAIKLENPTTMKIEGIDKELVGQVAAELRMIRPPEPYKGKGVRYVGEHVRRKAGKTGA
jgi:large subunit ribosomal protein L6